MSEEFVQRLVRKINEYDSCVIVGTTGSHKKKNKVIRVYMNGGKILTITANNGNLGCISDRYICKQYLNDRDMSRLAELKKMFVSAKTLEENNYEYLQEYLELCDKATNKKFGRLKASKTDEAKERKQQGELYKSLLLKQHEFVIFDIEFQSVAEMCYSEEVINREKKEKGSIRGLPCGKPDYIAATKDGFIIFELKTNLKACEGDAGIAEHIRDNKKLIEVNKSNHLLVREFLRRLNFAKEYNLLGSEHDDIIKSVLNKDIESLTIKAKLLLKVNEEATEEQYLKRIDKYGVSMDDVEII